MQGGRGTLPRRAGGGGTWWMEAAYRLQGLQATGHTGGACGRDRVRRAGSVCAVRSRSGWWVCRYYWDSVKWILLFSSSLPSCLVCSSLPTVAGRFCKRRHLELRGRGVGGTTAEDAFNAAQWPCEPTTNRQGLPKNRARREFDEVESAGNQSIATAQRTQTTPATGAGLLQTVM